jgi:hypothetical protein
VFASFRGKCRGSSAVSEKSRKKTNKKKKKKTAAPALPEPHADDVADAIALELEAASLGRQAAHNLDFLLVDLKYLNSSSEWRRLFGTTGVRPSLH